MLNDGARPHTVSRSPSGSFRRRELALGSPDADVDRGPMTGDDQECQRGREHDQAGPVVEPQTEQVVRVIHPEVLHPGPADRVESDVQSEPRPPLSRNRWPAQMTTAATPRSHGS
jgi:hypothetical protein